MEALKPKKRRNYTCPDPDCAKVYHQVPALVKHMDDTGHWWKTDNRN